MKRTRVFAMLLASLLLLTACGRTPAPPDAPAPDPAPVTEPAVTPEPEPQPQAEPAPQTTPEPQPEGVTAQSFYAALEGEWRCVGGETEGWAYSAEEELVSASLTFAPEGYVVYRCDDSAGNEDGAIIRAEDVRFVDEPYFDCSDWYVELTDRLTDARILDVGPDGERLVFSDPEAMGVLFFERVPTENLLTIDFCASREDAQRAFGPMDFYAAEWYDYDEPLQHQWAVVTALRDGTAVTFERCLGEEGAGELYRQDGIFVPMSVYAALTLDAGECAAFEVTQAWYSCLRVTASRGSLYGDYVFGSDNFFHLDDATRTVVGAPCANTAPATEHELRERLAGSWAFGENGVFTCALRFSYDGSCTITDSAFNSCVLHYDLDRLYAAEDEAPDLLCFSAYDEAVLAQLPDFFSWSGLGDYLIDFAQCGNETLMHLTQANNGDAALSYLIPHGANDYAFLLQRCEGASGAVPARRSESFPAMVWRYDSAQELLWVQEVFPADEDEAGYTLYRAAPDAPAVPYPWAAGDPIDVFAGMPDPCYPAAQYDVTVDAAGRVTALE